MSKRLNIVLPDTTVSVLNRVTTKGARSQFISEAVLHFVETHGKQNLRERLKQEGLVNAERDLAIAAEWFTLEDEASQKSEISQKPKKSSKTKRT